MNRTPMFSMALLGVTFVAAGNAADAAQRTFVSTAGFDTNSCSLTQPCRQFAKAITVTDPGGEIIVLDSGGYGPVTIGQDVTVNSPPGVYAGISVFAGNDGVTVAAPALKVVLRGLTINGQGGNNGIRVQSGEVHVESTVVSNMAQSGIRVEGGSSVRLSSTIVRSNGEGVLVAPASGSTRVLLRDSEVSNNTATGINVVPAAAASASVTVERSSVTRNNAGIVASGSSGSALLVVTQSVVSEHNNAGVAATGFGAAAYVRETAVTRNGTGFAQSSSGVFRACGSNLLVANGVAQAGVIDTTPCLDVAALSGPAGGDLTGNYPDPSIAVGAVTNSKLATNAVTSSKIAAGAVGTSELATSAVTANELASSAVTNTKIANDSVSRGKIQGGYSNGAISLNLNADQCADVNIGVPGAQAGDIPIFALQAGDTLPQKLIVMPLQSPSAGVVTTRFCNFAGVAASISNVGVYMLTIR